MTDLLPFLPACALAGVVVTNGAPIAIAATQGVIPSARGLARTPLLSAAPVSVVNHRARRHTEGTGFAIDAVAPATFRS